MSLITLKHKLRHLTALIHTGIASFYFRNPNPVDEENIIEWPPSTEQNATYLHLSNSFIKVVHGQIFGDHVFFWEEMLKQIRKL